LITANI